MRADLIDWREKDRFEVAQAARDLLFDYAGRGTGWWHFDIDAYGRLYAYNFVLNCSTPRLFVHDAVELARQVYAHMCAYDSALPWL